MRDRSGTARVPDTRARPCTWGRRAPRAIVARDSWPGSLIGVREAESSERGRIASPVGKHFDPEIEVDGRIDQRLDFLARRATDLLNPRALLSDHYALLALALDVEHRSNVHRAAIFAKLLDRARNAVRHFLLELLEGRLADELRCEESHGLFSDIVFWIEERALGQRRSDAIDECVDALAGERGDEKRAVVCGLERVAARVIERVDLVEHREHGCARRSGQRGGLNQRDKGALACVDEVGDEVGVVERAECGLAHGALEAVLRIQESGGVEEDDLEIVAGEDAEDAVAGGLGFGADDAEFLADEAVEQGGFAGVRLATEGEEAGRS